MTRDLLRHGAWLAAWLRHLSQTQVARLALLQSALAELVGPQALSWTWARPRLLALAPPSTSYLPDGREKGHHWQHDEH